MQKALTARGSTVSLLRLPGVKGRKSRVSAATLSEASEPALQEALSTLGLSQLNGAFLFLPAADAHRSLQSDSGQALKGAFLLAKLLSPLLRSTPNALFLTVTQLDGRFGTQTASGWLDRGVTGLTKTLSREWPEVHCRALDLAPDLAPALATEHLLAEAQDPDARLLETAWSPSGRVGLLPQRLEPEAQPLALPEHPVWLVSGGARGVTADCTLALAERAPGTFLLVGRSPLADEPDWASGRTTEADLRQAAMKALADSGEKPTPAKLRQMIARVEANRAIRQTLEQLQARGSMGIYLSADATHPEQIKEAIAPLVQKHGAVTGVIHGAGVLADKYIEKKTSADFDAVVGTKVEGLNALLEAVDPKALSHLLLFSSGAGFYGNAGQSDYAMGNEVLNRAALAFQQEHPSCRVVSYNWGPWEGGMVTPELKRMFEERGVEVIPVAEGARIFADAALQSTPGLPILLVGNALSGESEPAAPLQQRIWRRLDPLQNPGLKDHRIGIHDVVPAVLALEWMVDAVAACIPGYHLHRCTDFKVLKGILFDEHLAPEYLLEIQEVAAPSAGTRTFDLKVSSHQGKLPRYHYSVTCTFSQTPPEVPHEALPPAGSTHAGSTFYQNGTLFHGPLFQAVQEVTQLTEQQLVARCQAPWVPPEAQGQFPVGPFNAYALDPAFQVMLIWARHFHDAGSLPLQFDQLECFQPLPFESEYWIHLTVQEASETQLHAHLSLLGPDGSVYARMQGAQVTLSKNLNALFQPHTAH